MSFIFIHFILSPFFQAYICSTSQKYSLPVSSLSFLKTFYWRSVWSAKSFVLSKTTWTKLTEHLEKKDFFSRKRERQNGKHGRSEQKASQREKQPDRKEKLSIRNWRCLLVVENSSLGTQLYLLSGVRSAENSERGWEESEENGSEGEARDGETKYSNDVPELSPLVDSPQITDHNWAGMRIIFARGSHFALSLTPSTFLFTLPLGFKC